MGDATRASGRRKEIAIRTALGAGRGRLIRQFLTESVLLSLLGGALGLFLAYWGLNALLALAGGFLPRASEVGLDQRMVSFTLLLSILTGIGFGLAPALMASRAGVQETLKESGNAGGSPQRSWLRGALVVTEVALALILLISAGLLIKSFMLLQSIESGLRAADVLTLSVSLPESKYATPQSAAAFYQQLTERLSNLPGVEAAGAINLLPLQQSGYNGGIEIEGQEPLVEFRASSPDYFRALGIPLLSGRSFNAQDQENSPPVVIINQTLAKQLLPNQDPIGKRIRALGPDWKTVVGVVGDVKQWQLTRPVMPEIFIPYNQSRSAGMIRNMSLVVRAISDPGMTAAAVRQEVMAVDPNQPVHNVQTMEKVISESLSDRRLNMMLLSIFAGVALILAMVGIYSVMSYTVAQTLAKSVSAWLWEREPSMY